jgi:HlyD family secretion protein
MKCDAFKVSALLLCLLSACSSGDGRRADAVAEPAPLKIAVREVALREIAPEIALTGEFVPARMLRVVPEVDGLTVERVLADVGDRVERGDALIAVDDDGLRLELIQSGAEHQQAAIETAGVRRELSRIEEVMDIGGVSANERDLKRNALRAAEQRALVAAAARDLIVRRLNQARLPAPATGLVLERHVEAGDRTGTSQSPYFVIAADGGVEFEARVGARQLQALRQGMSATVRPSDGSPPLQGRVRIAADAVSGDDRLGKVRIALTTAVNTNPNPNSGADAVVTAARIGIPATASVALASRSGLFVPAAALRFSPEAWVWIVDREDRVRRRDLRLGAAFADGYEVLHGLVVGDRLVADAGALLVEGDRVAPVLSDGAASRPSPSPKSTVQPISKNNSNIVPNLDPNADSKAVADAGADAGRNENIKPAGDRP